MSKVLLMQHCRFDSVCTSTVSSRIFIQRYGTWLKRHIRLPNISDKLVLESIENQRLSPLRCIDFAKRQQCQLQQFEQNKAMPQLSSSEDYKVYQNVDLESFFGAEQKFDKVSDVCLLNDHFMLVKMPQKLLQTRSEASSVAVSATASTQDMLQQQQHYAQSRSSNLMRCFKCHSRNSRVSPIAEEPVQAKTPQRSAPVNDWYSPDDVEVFHTQTKVIAVNGAQVASHRHALKTSLHDEVSLQWHVDLAEPAYKAATSTPMQRPSMRFTSSVLHWLLKPFRRRQRTELLLPKAKRKIHAAVHKTYFVHWSKPPDALWHGYGVERTSLDGNQKVTLRRCRSSIF